MFYIQQSLQIFAVPYFLKPGEMCFKWLTFFPFVYYSIFYCFNFNSTFILLLFLIKFNTFAPVLNITTINHDSSQKM